MVSAPGPHQPLPHPRGFWRDRREDRRERNPDWRRDRRQRRERRHDRDTAISQTTIGHPRHVARDLTAINRHRTLTGHGLLPSTLFFSGNGSAS